MSWFYSMARYASIPLEKLSQMNPYEILTAFQRRLWAVGSLAADAYPAGVTYESNLAEIRRIWATFLAVVEKNGPLANEYDRRMVEGIEHKLRAMYGNLEQGNTALAQRIALDLCRSHTESLSRRLVGFPVQVFVGPPPAE